MYIGEALGREGQQIAKHVTRLFSV
jgi:hypothetical protein